MRFSLFSATIALTLPLAGVRAQLPPQVTPCIENCLVEAAAQDLDGCSVTDVQCLCANKKIQQDALSCLQQQCTTQELEEVQVFIAAECAPPASSTSSASSSTHSAAPSTSTHSASPSEAHTSEKTSASSITTISSTHLSSTTSVSATSLANSTTSLVSTSFTAPLALSSSTPPSSSSASSNTTASAAPARTNDAVRAGQDAIGMGIAALGAVFWGAMVW